jgi:hypothetical protein
MNGDRDFCHRSSGRSQRISPITDRAVPVSLNLDRRSDPSANRRAKSRSLATDLSAANWLATIQDTAWSMSASRSFTINRAAHSPDRVPDIVRDDE